MLRWLYHKIINPVGNAPCSFQTSSNQYHMKAPITDLFSLWPSWQTGSSHIVDQWPPRLKGSDKIVCDVNRALVVRRTDESTLHKEVQTL